MHQLRGLKNATQQMVNMSQLQIYMEIVVVVETACVFGGAEQIASR